MMRILCIAFLLSAFPALADENSHHDTAAQIGACMFNDEFSEEPVDFAAKNDCVDCRHGLIMALYHDWSEAELTALYNDLLAGKTLEATTADKLKTTWSGIFGAENSAHFYIPDQYCMEDIRGVYQD